MTEKRSFQAEVSRLLDIVAHSLYSDKKVFLRELISNASDACDRRRYAALTEEALGAADGQYRVLITPDKDGGTLTIEDNGIGMSEVELVENLGTIARSGTAAFAQSLGQDTKRDVTLIGQFGVGFYSCFMVADRVEVISRKAGEDAAYKWESDGKGEFTVGPAEKAEVGTRIILHLKADEREYLDAFRLRNIVQTYADHITLPVLLKDGDTEEALNKGSALWTRPKSEITPEQYKELYRSVGHGFDDPWLTIHWKAEGTIEYTSLLFVPSSKPFDLFDPARKHSVRLYVRRVFVTDDCAELVPTYLRFLKGLVDSEDLPLNISRETLQHNPMIAKIRQGLTKRVLNELGTKAADAPAEYVTFWDNFGAVLKEGLYEEFEHRDTLLKLARFRSSGVEGWTSLEDYVKRMRPGQKQIFFIAGDNAEHVAKSPQLEGFRAKGVEVLLLSDPIDEFWIPAVGKFQDFDFKSVTRGGIDLSSIESPDGKSEPKPEPTAGIDPLIAVLKLTLADAVKDVRSSDRLTESPVCLVADENDMDMHLARLMRQHRGGAEFATKHILEVNPSHPLIAALAEMVSKSGSSATLEDAAWLLLDQARLLEGESLQDPVAFARRLSSCMQRGLAA